MQVLCACDSVLAMAVALVRVANTVVVLAVLVRVRVAVVRVALVIAVRVSLVLTVVVHAVPMLVIAMRMIVLVSQVRLLVPERWHKHLTKSMTQQVTADKHASGLFLRLVTRDSPCTLYQVKLDPLITTRQRTLCARKLSKNASRRCIQKPNQVRWTWKFSMSQRHSLQIGTFVLITSCVFKNRTIKSAR